jgi:hypothetical protein
MTNKNKKRRTSSSGYRAPASARATETTRRPGLLEGMFAPRGSMEGMPKITTSIARGLVSVLATPALTIGVCVFLLLEWIGIVLSGFQGPFSVMVSALALPPLGTSFDSSLASTLFGGIPGHVSAPALLAGLALFVVVRAVAFAVIAAVLVDVLELGGISRGVGYRALQALPASLATNMAGISLIITATFVGSLLGGGIALLAQVAALVAGIYLFAAAPVIAAAERRRMLDSMTRSTRFARMPGSSNLTLAILYVIPAIAVAVAPTKPGSIMSVNPSPGAWAFVIVVNLLQVAVFAAVAFRYLSVADQVPAAPPPRQRQRGRR